MITSVCCNNFFPVLHLHVHIQVQSQIAHSCEVGWKIKLERGRTQVSAIGNNTNNRHENELFTSKPEDEKT